MADSTLAPRHADRRDALITQPAGDRGTDPYTFQTPSARTAGTLVSAVDSCS
jgi:hypothetical protein